MSDEEAIQLIEEYMKEHGRAWPQDVAEDLGLPFAQVMKITTMLMKKGVLEEIDGESEQIRWSAPDDLLMTFPNPMIDSIRETHRFGSDGVSLEVSYEKTAFDAQIQMDEDALVVRLTRLEFPQIIRDEEQPEEKLDPD